MKKLILFLISLNFAVASYYAVIKPYREFNIKASVSGRVEFVKKEAEGRLVKNDLIIRLDSKIDEIELEKSLEKLKNLKQILLFQEDILKSFQKVKSKSKVDKDNQKIIVLNTKNQIADLENKIATLKDKIQKKQIFIKNKYIDTIFVDVGNFVNPGAKLIKAYDLSKAKLEIFVSVDKIKNIKNRAIYLNGKKTNLKINKIYKVADNKHLGSYKVEIILDKPKTFSKLIKVEFK